MSWRGMALGLGLLCAFPAASSAELLLRAVAWQLPSAPGTKPRGFRPIERWIQAPSAKLTARPRAVITVANRGPKTAEGMVLRYAVAARMAPVAGGKEGVWTVPFYLNERRLQRIGANQTRDIPLNDLVLDVFLKKNFRAGYWPDALKIQVMVEPRNGDTSGLKILEHTLPVASN